jgi:uncharacterized RDD family membrane protein YckC
VIHNDFVPAPIGRRFFAFIIDSAIVSGILYLLLLLLLGAVFSFTGIPTEEEIQWKIYEWGATLLVPLLLGVLFVVLVSAAIWHGYFVFFEHMYQKTPGKKALGLFVVSADGNVLSFKQCVLREIFRCYVDMLFVFPAIISVFCTQKKQRVGDLASNTLVLFSKNLLRDMGYLYLSREQYVLRLSKYKVVDCNLEEANSFLNQMQSGLLDSNSALGEQALELQARLLVLQDEAFNDEPDMKMRFLAEYFLQNRRPL